MHFTLLFISHYHRALSPTSIVVNNYRRVHRF